jgi:cobalt-zinc-cadmium efflux system protein
MSDAHNHSHAAGSTRALALTLALTATFMVVEAAGGWLTGSLALIADAGHMLTDVAALSLSLVAIRIAARPATHERTFGYKRLEVLAAAINGLALVAISAVIVREAAGRWNEPEEIHGGPMLAVAFAGLVVNIIGMRLLSAGGAHQDNLNTRGAYLHVLGDLLGSVGAIAAALIILATGWTRADPLISLLISVLIVVSAWRLLRDSVDVLLEAAPRGIDVGRMEGELAALPGVRCVHDVHVWTVTSGFVAMSGHVTIEDDADPTRVMVAAHDLVRQRYGIGHATLQVETPEMEAALPDSHLPGDVPCLSGHVRAGMAAEAHPH